MAHLHSQGQLRKMLAVYEKLGLRRVARSDRQNLIDEDFHIDLTNLWHTKTRAQEQQYTAIKDSGLFSQLRTKTFLRFNYRNTETGTFNYAQTFKKIERGSLGSRRGNSHKKGTMQVTDLWGEPQMQEVMGSPSFPRDRLKILKIWAGKGAPRPAKVRSNVRLQTQP